MNSWLGSNWKITGESAPATLWWDMRCSVHERGFSGHLKFVTVRLAGSEIAVAEVLLIGTTKQGSAATLLLGHAAGAGVWCTGGVLSAHLKCVHFSTMWQAGAFPPRTPPSKHEARAVLCVPVSMGVGARDFLVGRAAAVLSPCNGGGVVLRCAFFGSQGCALRALPRAFGRGLFWPLVVAYAPLAPAGRG